ELTAAQQLTAANGFEALEVAAGYWSTSGEVGAFDSVTIAEGGTLRVNEIVLGDGETDSPIQTAAVRTNGLLVLNFGSDETVSNLADLAIDGTGQLQLIGDAVFTLDTANVAHTGGTIVSNGGLILSGVLQGDVKTEGTGVFQLGAGGTDGSFAGNIVNDGRFIFNRSDNYDFLGGFSGTGVLDKMGDGALTFMGDYAFRGVTNILGGSVRIGGAIDPTTEFDLGEGGTLDITGKDQTIGGLDGAQGSSVVIGDSQLTVSQTNNTAFGGNISGNGSLVKEGAGTLNLTGDSSYTGPTSVNGGKLAVNGSIVSPVTVNSGGTLGGNGSVGSTNVGDGGRIAPGNSIGQLTVNGDLTFVAGSTYEVEANAAGEADRLDATGAVTIASTAGVTVLAENGNYNARTDYVILTGAGGITGTFGSVTSNLAFLNPLLRYGANSVTLSLYRNDIDFADVAVGFNQSSVATAVQALGPNNALYEAVLAQNAATAQAIFGDLSGEILASTISGLTDDSRHLRNALMGLQGREESGAFVWGSTFGSWGKFDANRGNFAMDT
ncbi:MAG: autotransporter-associated beta strand repeat-containing protein, partial [Sphingopyxis sp.]|nr:autotransporter-associated beta strand repeat-containing protein [Sphingopyxis sp.]